MGRHNDTKIQRTTGPGCSRERGFRCRRTGSDPARGTAQTGAFSSSAEGHQLPSPVLHPPSLSTQPTPPPPLLPSQPAQTPLLPPSPPPLLPPPAVRYPSDGYEPTGVIGDETVRVWFVTLATRPHPNLDLLIRTCARNAITLNVLGWKDGRRQGHISGWGLKIRFLREFVETNWPRFRPGDLVMYVDGYDVIFCGGAAEIVEAYRSYEGVDLLFSGEAAFWFKRDRDRRYRALVDGTEGHYRHLCAGAFVGSPDCLRHLLATNPYDDRTNDQLWWIRILTSPATNARASGKSGSTGPRASHGSDTPERLVGRGNGGDTHRPFSIEVDRWGRLGTTVWGALSHIEYDRRAGRFYNRISRTHPTFLHFDGGKHWKALLPHYYRRYMGRGECEGDTTQNRGKDRRGHNKGGNGSGGREGDGMSAAIVALCPRMVKAYPLLVIVVAAILGWVAFTLAKRPRGERRRKGSAPYAGSHPVA